MPEFNKSPDNSNDTFRAGILANGEIYIAEDVETACGAKITVVRTFGSTALKQRPKGVEIVNEPEQPQQIIPEVLSEPGQPPYTCPNGDECPSDSTLVQPAGEWGSSEEGGKKDFYCPDCMVPFSADLTKSQVKQFLRVYGDYLENMDASEADKRIRDFRLIAKYIREGIILPEDF